MKKFEIFRYLKKFSALILAIAVVGSVLIYIYGQKKQQYTATATIKYLHEGIKDGYAPDGTELDVNEIYSSAVVAQAMDSLGISGELNIIRSRCKVEEVIPDDEQALIDAKVKLGEESDYAPDEYKVSLVVDGAMGEDYARNVLDAIIQSYFTIYTEKYVEQRLTLNSSSNLLENGYDYYECIYMLENDTTDMIYYLSDKKKNYPDFRASTTGCSYEDLYDMYEELADYQLPKLYAQVVSGPQVRDGDILKKSLKNQIKTAKKDEKVKKERRDYLYSIIKNYSNKNKDIIDYHFHNGTNQNDNSYILKDVEENADGSDVEVTYDTLMLEYNELDKAIRKSEINRKHLEYILKVMDNVSAGSSGTEETHKSMEEAINLYEKTLSKYYDVVNKTSKEFNGQLSSEYLKMVNSIQVYPAININTYVMLAAVFFFIVGCIGAIVLGRAGDFIEYLLYVDKKTGLANRQKCDSYIDNLSKNVLPDNFTCIYLNFTSLSSLTKKYGYSVGDSVMKDFAGLLNALSDEDGFIGYNGVGKFMMFVQKCNSQKAEAIMQVLKEQVEEYNNINPDYKMDYTYSYSVSTDDNIYEARALLRNTIAKMNNK